MKHHRFNRVAAKVAATSSLFMLCVASMYSAATTADGAVGTAFTHGAGASYFASASEANEIQSWGDDNPNSYGSHFLSNGQYVSSYGEPSRLGPKSDRPLAHSGAIRLHPHATTPANAKILVDTPVQTVDVFAPPPTFDPSQGPNLLPVNIHPVWSADQSYIIFSSNRDASGNIAADGHFHIWAIPSSGAAINATGTAVGLPIQITSGNGDEFYPSLTPSNNELAFTCNDTSGSNLFEISLPQALPFGSPSAPVNVQSLEVAGSPNWLTPPADHADFTTIGRSSLSPGGQEIVYSAVTAAGPTAGHAHLYFEYLSTHGYLPQNSPGNAPAKLTDGPADDNNPAWAPGATYIAFDSTAGSIVNNPTSSSLSPTNAPSNTTAPIAPGQRTIWVLGDGSSVNNGGGAAPNPIGANPRQMTIAGVDSGEPAWSTIASPNPYLNPSDSHYEYLAFSRAQSYTSNHDIYYITATSDYSAGASTFTAESNTNSAIHLNTSEYNDAAQTQPTQSFGDPGNIFDDRYPTWSPFATKFDIAYQSPRTVTYYDYKGTVAQAPVSTNPPPPIETAESLGHGIAYVGNQYIGLLESEVVNVNAPNIIRFDGQEVLHINNGTQPVLPSSTNQTGSALRIVQTGSAISVTVRLTDRESGINDSRVFLQIKNPNSKYQDSQGLEHKIFARDFNYDVAYGHGTRDSGTMDSMASDWEGGYNVINGVKAFQEGAIGAWVDNTDAISIGTDVDPLFNDPTNIANYTTKEHDFIPWGPEYECQLINPQYTDSPTGPAASNYVAPYYLAGYDCNAPFSGNRPLVNGFSTETQVNRPATEWLPMTKAPVQDANGGTLYTTTWVTPSTPSDFYLDIIAFDKAVFPAISDPKNYVSYDGGIGNWRIYDNVWGMSDASFDGTGGVLLISDYALGQKFHNSAFGGLQTNNESPMTLFGSESYVSDVDPSVLPNAVFYNVTPDAKKNPLGLEIFRFGEDRNNGYLTQSATYRNGLGYFSYVDREINKGLTDGQSLPQNNYSIWRTLCRGPVPSSVLNGYLPTFANQPAVNDPQNAGANQIAKQVTEAPKCVVWLAPYTGDLLEGPGSLDDPVTQAQLSTFVAAGGRLFVSGQDIASTISIANNNPFLSKTLSASLVNPDIYNWQLAGDGQRLTGTTESPVFGDAQSTETHITSVTAGGFVYIDNPVNAGRLTVSTDADTIKYPGEKVADASLSQVGNPHHINYFGPRGHLDAIAPLNGATLDINYTGGPGALLYNNVGNGGKIVYGGFGIEGLGQDYYKYTDGTLGDFFFPVNQRTNLLHHITSWLRTGTFTGKVLQTTGTGTTPVIGATVYIVGGPSPGGRYEYSALTGPDGGYTISGVEPGQYTVSATRTGFHSSLNTDVQTVEGDDSNTFSQILLAPQQPGTITGKVIDKNTQAGIPGATITFTSQDGQVTESVVSAFDGSYSISGVPPGVYSVVVTAVTYQNLIVPIPPGVTVTENSTTNDATTVFALTPLQATVSGRVYDASNANSATNGIAGATVTATLATAPGTVYTTTTAADGSYKFDGLATPSTGLNPGKYALMAAAAGFKAQTIYITVVAAQTLTNEDIGLTKIVVLPNGVIGGLVTAPDSSPISGASISFVDTTTGLNVATITTSAPASPTAPYGDGKPLNFTLQLPPSTYTVTISAKGYITQTLNVTVPSATFIRADAQLQLPPPIHLYPAGLNFISAPYDYSGTSLDDIFGKLNPGGNRSHVAVWQPTLSNYVLDPTPPADALHLGQGYWVRLTTATGPRFIGTAPTSTTIAVQLNPSWNMIGVPSLNPINVADLTFANPQAGGQPISFADASGVADHLVDPVLYRYDPTTNTYQGVVATTSSAGDPRQTQLQPWQAYWIRAYVPTTVNIPTR